jgi:hypothetical protein
MTKGFGCGKDIDDHWWCRTIVDGVVVSIRCERCRLIPMDLLMRREWSKATDDFMDKYHDALKQLA